MYFFCTHCPTTTNVVSRLPCAKGGGFLRSKKTEGLSVQNRNSLQNNFFYQTIPQSKIKDFCQPPLHKGATAAAGFPIAKALWYHQNCWWFYFTRQKPKARAFGFFVYDYSSSSGRSQLCHTFCTSSLSSSRSSSFSIFFAASGSAISLSTSGTICSSAVIKV